MMQLNAQFWPQIVPRRGYEAPKGADSKEKMQFWPKPTRKFKLKNG